MQLGVFAREFARLTVAETLGAVANAGLSAAQFNLSVLGLPTVPEAVPAADIAAAARPSPGPACGWPRSREPSTPRTRILPSASPASPGFLSFAGLRGRSAFP